MEKQLSELTSKQLFELAKQREDEEKREATPKLRRLATNDEYRIYKLAEIYLNEEQNLREIDTQQAYELLMELAYGEDIWEYINSLEEK